MEPSKEVTRAVPGAALRQLGPYRLEGRLGQGGMGDVYRATDTRLNRAVAVKLVRGYEAADPVRRKRFELEAQAASALNHPHICTVHDVGEADGCPFLVMEMLEGETLADRLKRGPVAVGEAIVIATQIADALEAAHAHRIVHRDIKPANIFITTRQQVKVMDFGIATRLGHDAGTAESATTVAPPTRLTELGAAVGTVAYMSPEQARGEALDARTDLFSLGVVLYELLTGQQPFRGQTDAVVFDALLHQTPAAPSESRSNVPSELDAIVSRLLAKDRERRTQSAATVRAKLVALGAALRGNGTPSPRAAGARRSLSRTILTASAIAVLGAAAWFGWTLINPPLPRFQSLAILPPVGDVGTASDVVEGLVDAVSADLSREVPSAIVPIVSTAAYRGTTRSPQDIGRELNAGGLVTFAAARAGDRLQLTASVIDARDGTSRWTRAFDRSPADLAGIQSELTGSLAALVGATGRTPAPAAGAASVVNPQAHELYLRARYRAWRWNEADIDQAITLLEQAVAIQPSFGAAQSLLGFAYGVKSANYRANDPVWREKGFAAIGKALALDPSDPEALTARSLLLWSHDEGFPSREALAECRKALAVRPTLDQAWNQRAVILLHVGHLDAALKAIERATTLNPANINARFRVAPIRVYQQRYEEAIAVMHRVPKEAYPSQWTYQMAWALIALGRLDEAGEVIDAELASKRPDQGGVVHAARAMLRLKRGDRTGALADLEVATRGRGFVHFHHTAYSIGVVYAQLGDFARAQRWIEEAANGGFPCFPLFESDPYLEELRKTERFRTFVKALRDEWQHIPGEE